MKNYKILYAYYPFKKETVKPLVEMVEANTLEDAFAKMNDMYGHAETRHTEPVLPTAP